MMANQSRCDRPSSSGCHVGPLEEALALARRRAPSGSSAAVPPVTTEAND